MKRWTVVSLLCFAFSGLLFYGCGGGGGSSSSGGGSQVKTTPITSERQAINVASASFSDFSDLVEGSSSIGPEIGPKSITSSETYKSSSALSRIVFPILNAVKKAPSDVLNTRSLIPVNGTENCTYGGTTIYNGSYDNSTGNVDVEVKMDKCNDDNETIDSGVFRIKGKYIDDNNFNLTVTTVGSFTSNAIDGSDNTTGKDFELVLKSENGKESDALIANNGFLSDKWIYEGSSYSDKVKFYNFKLTDNDTDTGEEFTANGIVTYDLNPESACEGLSGTYEYRTIAPVEYNETSDLLISGDVKINDNTEIKWDNGIVYIHYNGAEVYHCSEDELGNVCPALD